MEHSPGFLEVVNEAKPRVKELTPEEALEKLADSPDSIIVDVREDYEWNAGHVQKAVHLGKGVLERDIEKKFPNKQTTLLMYCGGGYRSILTADVAQKMGYSNVFSISGGYKGIVAEEWPIQS